MERSVDDSDFIAKSDILKAIDDDACWAETMYQRFSPTSHEGMKWGARLAQLVDIRDKIANLDKTA